MIANDDKLCMMHVGTNIRMTWYLSRRCLSAPDVKTNVFQTEIFVFRTNFMFGLKSAKFLNQTFLNGSFSWVNFGDFVQ